MLRHAVTERKMFKAAKKVIRPANKVLSCLIVLVTFP